MYKDMPEFETRKDYILALVSDLVSDFVYYQRKECEDLGVDEIREAFDSGEVTVDEVVEAFRKELSEYADEKD